MGEIKLFRREGEAFAPLRSQAVKLEKHLQCLIEENMEALLGVRFLASEYVTGKAHRGRIDSLGLDENFCPVIVEYKRSLHENVINQGLFYLDWLLDHKAEFEMLVLKSLGQADQERIDWSAPRLLCIAQDFTHYDGYAVQQINRNIELIRYQLFGDDLLLLELMNATTADASAPSPASTESSASSKASPKSSQSTHDVKLAAASDGLQALYKELCDYMLSLGDDVQERKLKHYVAFKRIRNFASVVVLPQLNNLTVYLKLDPATVEIEEGYSRDVSQIGHWGTGDVELTLRTAEDVERAKPLIERSFASN